MGNFILKGVTACNLQLIFMVGMTDNTLTSLDDISVIRIAPLEVCLISFGIAVHYLLHNYTVYMVLTPFIYLEYLINIKY